MTRRPNTRRGANLLTLLYNCDTTQTQDVTASPTDLAERRWCQLVMQLSELDAVDFEALVMAVRLRGRFNERTERGDAMVR